MYSDDADIPAWGRDLVLPRTSRLLEALGERALPDADWVFHSHGATLAVESPHPNIFDRLVLVLPRPTDRPAEEFRPWVEGRLGRLDKYLQRTNLGRVVRQLPAESLYVASVARRVGHDPSRPMAYFPPPEELPGLLRGFIRDLEVYTKVMGDTGLRYVGGLRLFIVPRGARTPEWKLGLEILDTVVGRREDTSSIAPLTLVRAVIREMAGLLEVRNLVHEGSRTERRSRADVVAHFCTELNALADRSEQPGFMLAHVHKQLDEIRPPKSRGPLWPWLLGTGTLLGIGSGLWLLLN